MYRLQTATTSVRKPNLSPGVGHHVTVLLNRQPHRVVVGADHEANAVLVFVHRVFRHQRVRCLHERQAGVEVLVQRVNWGQTTPKKN